MSVSRERMLERVRQAVVEGNRAGAIPALEPRGTVGYQGCGTDAVARFAEELKAAGGTFHRVEEKGAAVRLIVSLLQERNARPVLLGRGQFLDSLALEEPLRAAGLEPIPIDGLTRQNRHESFFAAAAGITGVDFLIAETGSVVVQTAPDQPRSSSLLPAFHIAVAASRQLLPDLFDLYAGVLQAGNLPACVSLITGPSKTGDIELRLVTGVHGPGEIHVILIDSPIS